MRHQRTVVHISHPVHPTGDQWAITITQIKPKRIRIKTIFTDNRGNPLNRQAAQRMEKTLEYQSRREQQKIFEERIMNSRPGRRHAHRARNINHIYAEAM